MHTRTELLCSCKNTALEHELVFRTATKQLGGEKHCNYQIIPIIPFGVFRKNTAITKLSISRFWRDYSGDTWAANPKGRASLFKKWKMEKCGDYSVLLNTPNGLIGIIW